MKFRTFRVLAIVSAIAALGVPFGASPASAATSGTWTGSTYNSAANCYSAAQVPSLDAYGRVTGLVAVKCGYSTFLTVRGRLRSDRTFSDVTVAQKGCSSSDGTCAITIPGGWAWQYFRVTCPQSTTRVSHGYHTDIIIYPGANVYAATGSTSGSTSLSPYCSA